MKCQQKRRWPVSISASTPVSWPRRWRRDRDRRRNRARSWFKFGSSSKTSPSPPCDITTTKRARCRRVSHAFSRLMRARSRRRMRSLRATVRSHAWNRRCRHAFHYQKRGGRARVLSCFVGGAPLIYAPRHCDVREWVTTFVTFLFFLPPSHHVSRADSKISTHTQRILSATDNMEAARNCLCTFFCL